MTTSPITDLKVLPRYDGEGHILSWRIDPYFKESLPYNFTIESSETPLFSELILSKDVGDNFYGIDDSPVFKLVPESYVYRVKLVTGDGNIHYSNTLNFGSKQEDNHKYLKAADIVRREFLRFRYTGYEGWLLKRKNYGAIAEQDVDPVSGLPMTNNKNNYGTGLVAGYYPPLKLRYGRETQSDSFKLAQTGEGVVRERVIGVRLPGFPSLGTYDVLVTKDNEHYSLYDIRSAYFPGTEIVMIQTCAGKLIATTDPVYSIEVPNE